MGDVDVSIPSLGSGIGNPPLLRLFYSTSIEIESFFTSAFHGDLSLVTYKTDIKKQEYDHETVNVFHVLLSNTN